MKNKRIAVFFGGKITKHLVLVRNAAKKLKVELDLISYNRVSFNTVTGKIKLNTKNIDDYDVLFFRTTGKHWEEVNLILDGVTRKEVVIVDPLVKKGRPSDACKAYQMLELTRAGIEVPKTLYGSLFYLKNEAPKYFKFPMIVKGSGGDRGTRVFKADNLEQLGKLVMDLRKSEVSEGKRYMAQEYIPNKGDYRVLVLGEKVLGVMKRTSQNKDEFKNNYSAGGKVEVADLPEEIKQLAVKAAKVCGLMVAGVDVAFRDDDFSKPIIWEVNKGPQFKGFMKATGIDVPSEIVKFLVSLK